MTCAVHGDDFLSEASEEDLDWFDEVLDSLFLVKRKGRAGPGARGGSTVDYLHRGIVFYPDYGFEYCPDEKHTLKLLELLGMTECGFAPTPMVQGEKAVDGLEADLLPEAQKRIYMLSLIHI